MPSFKPKNRLTARYLEAYRDAKFTTEPAVKVRAEGPYIDFTYSDDLEHPQYIEPAVKVTFENGTVLYLDSDEVVIG